MPQVPQVQGTRVPASPPGGVGPAASAQVPQVLGAGTQVPLAQVSGAQASAAPGGASAASAAPSSGNPMMDALFAGMQQLQTMQAQGMRDKSVVSNAPEAVKPGTTALPMLKAPDPMSGSLDFQDWLELIAGLMGDLSDSSHDWWTAVLQVSRDAYERWVKATPLDRIRVEVDERPELVEGKWSRVNARACTMILAALDQGVKAEMVARRTTQVATQIMFRLYTLYQPGGSTEKALVLNHLQHPSVVQDVVSGVAALRAWGRWHKRCIDCGMVAPDPTVLAGALTEMTNHILSQNPDPMFRTQMVRSMLHIETHPSEDAVQEYYKHLLAEFETMAGAQIATQGGSGNNVALKAMDATGGKSGGKGGETKGGGKGKPKFGAKCKAPHSMSDLPAAARFKKCLNCGSEDHRVKDCKAGKAEPTAPEQKPSVQAASTSTSSSAPPVVQAAPVLSMDSFLQHASHALRQLEAAHATHGQQPSQGPVSTVPAPAAPTPDGDGLQQPSNPSLKKLTLCSSMPASCLLNDPQANPPSRAEIEGLPGAQAVESEPPLIGHALLDSGATHPLRPASSQEEWVKTNKVQVGLAGGHTSHMRITKHGVILTPPGRDELPTAIVPLGQLVARLGYMLSWTADECFLRSPEGEHTTLMVQNGCPVIERDRALTLIAELEAQRENARSTLANRAANEVSSTLVIAKALQAFGLPLGGQVEHISPSLKPGRGHGKSAQMTAPIWPGQTPLLEPKKGVCGTQVLDPKVCLQQSSTIWFRLDADDECDDNPTRYQLDGDGDSSVYDLDWTRLPLSPLGRDGPAQVPGPLPCCPGRFSLDGFGGLCVFGPREVQPTNRQDLATRPGGERETTVPSSVAVPATSPREGGTRNARQRLTANLLFQLLLLCLLLLGVRGAVFAPCPGVRNPPAAASGTPVPYWVEEEPCVRLRGLSGVAPEPPVQEESQQPLAERVLLTTVRLAAAADGLVTAVCWGMPGFYLFRKRDHPVCAVFMLFVFLQVVSAASQQDEEPEDMLLPVPLDADLMLAVRIFGVAFCAIVLWEFLKWSFALLSRRTFGTSSVLLSPRKARKLQRLRNRTEQAIRAEISEREAAASSSQRLVTASGRNAPASTTQADEAPTRFFATLEGNKLHRTKACSTLAHSHRFIEFEVCQQCHRSQADCTKHSTR